MAQAYNSNPFFGVYNPAPTSGSSNVPAAPTTQQLNAAPGSFTGTSGGAPSGNFQTSVDASSIAPQGYVQASGPGGYYWSYNPTAYQSMAATGNLTGSAQYNGQAHTPSGNGGGGGTSPGPGTAPSGSLPPGAINPFGTGAGGPGGGQQVGGQAGGGYPTGGYAAPTGAQAAIGSNPWSLAANSSAATAGQAAGAQAGANFGQAGNMRAGANTLQTGAGQVLNTAFDPQNALYNRTAQQLQDQVRVGEAARGITMSPYGAGVEGKAMSDFNIDWQNAQLGRQTAGLGAAGTATNSAGTANTTGANIGQQGVQQTAAVGGMPYDSYNTDTQNNIQNWIAYMNQANAATSGAMQNYPNQLAQQSMTNAGGVPFIPQNNSTFNFG